ncbi:hypothetical protein Nmel_014096, partial [Mimus melanotis]
MAHCGHSPLEVREGGGGNVNKNFSRLGSPLHPFILRINDCGIGPAPCPPGEEETPGRPAGLRRAAGARRRQRARERRGRGRGALRGAG